MRQPVSIALCFVFSSLVGGASLAADLIISNVTIVSPQLKKPIKNANILIEDGRIRLVQQAVLEANHSVKNIDGSGKYLIPGLTDSHLHTTLVPGLGLIDAFRAMKHPDLVSVFQAQLPRSLLYYGITQFIDPAATKDHMAAFRQEPLKPDSFFCGAAPLLQGYPLVELHIADPLKTTPYFIYEPEKETKTPTGMEPQQHTAEAVVKRMHKDGAHCLKLFFEDGWGPVNDWPLLSDSSYIEAISTAKALGMPVMAHANSFSMQQLAVKLDVDILAHGLWNWGKYQKSTELPEEIKKHLDQVIANKIGFQSTFRVIEGIKAMYDESLLTDERLTAIVPSPLLDWYQKEEGQWFKRVIAEEEGFVDVPTAAISQLFAGVLKRGASASGYLYSKNYPVLLASDQPANPGHGNHPGLSTNQELHHMADAGLSLPSILAAATINNARQFKLDKDYGTIEVGKIANLVLLNSNPLETIEAYADIEMIVLHGEAIARSSLAANQ